MNLYHDLIKIIVEYLEETNIYYTGNAGYCAKYRITHTISYSVKFNKHNKILINEWNETNFNKIIYDGCVTDVFKNEILPHATHQSVGNILICIKKNNYLHIDNMATTMHYLQSPIIKFICKTDVKLEDNSSVIVSYALCKDQVLYPNHGKIIMKSNIACYCTFKKRQCKKLQCKTFKEKCICTWKREHMYATLN